MFLWSFLAAQKLSLKEFLKTDRITLFVSDIITSKIIYIYIYIYIERERESVCVCGNLLSFLLRCGTRPYEWGTQKDSNSLVVGLLV